MRKKSEPGVIVKCAVCPTMFKAPACELAAGKGKYCSRACFSAARKTKVTASCSSCRAVFAAHASELKRGGGKFCSKDCYMEHHSKKKPIESRFWPKVGKTKGGGCWLWSGGTKGGGYGSIAGERSAGRRPMLGAHRVAWELTYGAIPNGLFVLHRCDVKACVNPAHLFLGTHAENMADMVKKGLQWRRTRESLTAADVARIRCLNRDLGMSAAEITRYLGLSYNIVWRATTGRTRGT